MYTLGWITGATIGFGIGTLVGMYGMMLVYRKRLRNALCPDTGYVNPPNPDTPHSWGG